MDDQKAIEQRKTTPEAVVALALISVWLRWPRSTIATLTLKDVRRAYAQITGTRLSDVVVEHVVTDALAVLFGIPILSGARGSHRRLIVSHTRIEKIAAAYGLTEMLGEQPRPIQTAQADLLILETMWSLPIR